MINSFSLKKVVMISLVIMVVGLFFVNKQLSNAEGKDHMHSLKISQMLLYTSDAKSFTTTKKSVNDIEITRDANEIRNDLVIQVNGTYEDEPLKVFSEPVDSMELSASFIEPSEVVETTDLNIYNDHFIRVKDKSGHTWFFDINQSDYSIKPNSKLAIVGHGDNKAIAKNIKNISMNLQTHTFISGDEIDNLLIGTNLYGIGNSVQKAEMLYGVNSLFIISLAVVESGWGESYLATTRNNLFGICAYDGNEGAATSFATKEDCVLHLGKLISEEYFSKGRTDLYSINAIYASNSDWANMVGSMMNYFASNL